MRGTPTTGPYFNIEIVETRVLESRGCSICTRLSASISKVIATATLAPFGQGTGRLIIVNSSERNGPGTILRIDQHSSLGKSFSSCAAVFKTRLAGGVHSRDLADSTRSLHTAAGSASKRSGRALNGRSPMLKYISRLAS